MDRDVVGVETVGELWVESAVTASKICLCVL
jgi:hypothetical protein